MNANKSTIYHLDKLTGATLIDSDGCGMGPELAGLATLTCRRFRSLDRARAAAERLGRGGVVVVVDENFDVVRPSDHLC